MSSVEEITKVLAFLAALYPRFELTAATIKAYSHILKDIAPDLLQAAAEKLGGESTFFPAAAEIRQAAFDMLDSIDGIPDPYEAYAMVQGGYFPQGVELHPLVRQAFNTVGDTWSWRHSTNPASDRARFIDAYTELLQRRKNEVRATPQVRKYIENGRQAMLDAGGYDAEKVASEVAKTANRMMRINR